MPKLIRVEVWPGVYTKVPEDQAQQAEAKGCPLAANKARRGPRTQHAQATKSEE